MARPGRLELPTLCLEGRRSIQLSYGRVDYCNSITELETSDQPIASVKTAWKTTLRKAGVAYFPIYHLRHVFCTRLSWVAPDAVVQRAMRHSSPETKRHYQLGMVEQLRQNLEKANERVYGERKVLRFYDAPSVAEREEEIVVGK